MENVQQNANTIPIIRKTERILVIVRAVLFAATVCVNGLTRHKPLAMQTVMNYRINVILHKMTSGLRQMT